MDQSTSWSATEIGRDRNRKLKSYETEQEIIQVRKTEENARGGAQLAESRIGVCLMRLQSPKCAPLAIMIQEPQVAA